MSAYGFINDESGPVAFVKDGHIYRDNEHGELIGFEENGSVFDLQRKYVGALGELGAGTGTPVIRRLLDAGA